ncbi:oxidoreductase [Variovorax sp. ZT5P49]|uniref:oxidoreductase n=1 Tax=Variovorax sp. ZT5P49 TaxID=3443733 RepID=UPI003F472158
MGFTEKNLGNQSGKTFAITGANTGLGFQTARALAMKGGRVILMCRSEPLARAAMDAIRKHAPRADLKFVPLDLADLDSVAAAAEILLREPKIDVLINNAGLMVPPLQRTRQGFESQMGVNHFGHFALTGRLLPKLMTDGTRIVVLSSVAHKKGLINFEDINARKHYDASKQYASSKLANLVFSLDLNARLATQGTKAICVAAHPGLADTELSRYLPNWVKIFLPLLRPLVNSAASGAWPTLLAATDERAQGGEYYGPSRRGETAGPATHAHIDERAKDPDVAKRLWDLSIEMTKVKPLL